MACITMRMHLFIAMAAALPSKWPRFDLAAHPARPCALSSSLAAGDEQRLGAGLFDLHLSDGAHLNGIAQGGPGRRVHRRKTQGRHPVPWHSHTVDSGGLLSSASPWLSCWHFRFPKSTPYLEPPSSATETD